MDIIVQKFGGTSLNSPQKRLKVAGIVKKASEQEGLYPVVVVSAIGRCGAPYATDSLLDFAREVEEHIPIREKDLLMSCGEIISTVIMVQVLRNEGIKARALTGGQAGILTSKDFGCARIKEVNPDYIFTLLKDGFLPVVAGFQGITSRGEITTLGRGGSDITASILAASVNAEYVTIYSDVEGIMTADPLKVSRARLLKYLNYKEVCELAYHGARVLHPRAAEIAMKNNLTLKIGSIFKEKPGTVVNNSGKAVTHKQNDSLVTAVTSRSQIIFAGISLSGSFSYQKGTRIFSLLKEAGISADLINIRPAAISFIVREEKREDLKKILAENKFDFQLRKDLVKVSVVGSGMTGQPGVMAKIISALREENISVFQATDSHITISCLLEKNQEQKALNVLHEKFKLHS